MFVRPQPRVSKTIILDCCHSGALGAVPSLQNDLVHLREGVSIITGSRASQPTVESGGHGLFTSIVAEGLAGGAADITGRVTVASLYAYVDQLLGPWDLRPLFKSHVSRLTSLRTCTPQVDLSILRLLPRYFRAPNFEFPLDPSYEPEAEPHDPEHERIFGHLQAFRDARLLVPVGERHLYHAAMNSKACRLTANGQFYWQLVNAGRL